MGSEEKTSGNSGFKFGQVVGDKFKLLFGLIGEALDEIEFWQTPRK